MCDRFITALFAAVPSAAAQRDAMRLSRCRICVTYEGWNFNSGNYLFTTDTK